MEKGMIHQGQGLGRNVGNVAPSHRGEGLGCVKGQQQRGQKVSPGSQVNAAASVSVRGAQLFGSASKQDDIVFVNLHRRPGHLQIETSRDCQDGIPDAFSLQPPQVHAMQQPVFGVEPGGRSVGWLAGHSIGLRQQDSANQLLEGPLGFYPEPVGEMVQQLRVAGAFPPASPKLSTEATIPRPKRWCQTRFTHTRASNGLGGSGQGFGQLQAAAATAGRQRFRSGDGFQESPGDSGTLLKDLSPMQQGLVDSIAVQQGRGGGGGGLNPAEQFSLPGEEWVQRLKSLFPFRRWTQADFRVLNPASRPAGQNEADWGDPAMVSPARRSEASSNSS